MQLIERRIGLLFAVFLALLVLGAGRAAWLGVVKAGTLQAGRLDPAGVRPRSCPPRRGTITDRNGTELAVSQPAMTIAATPYLIKDPTQLAARLAGLLDKPEDELLRQLARRDTGFAYLARHVPADARAQGPGAERRGARVHPRVHARLPARVDGLAAARQRRHRRPGPRRARVLARQASCGGRDGERRLVKDALGDAIELRETKPTEPGDDLRLTLDANIQDKAEEVLAEVGRGVEAQGRHRDRDGPARRRAARARQLAAGERQRARRRARRSRARTARSAPPTSPARPSRRSPSRARWRRSEVTPETEFNLAPTIMVADREIGESHPRGYVTLNTRQILEQSSNVGAITIGQRLGAERFDKLGAPLRLRPADRDRPAGRGAGHRAPARALLRLLDGQPADRPGHRGHADADGDRLRGDRQRRHPAARAHRRVGRRRARRASRRATA